LRKTRYLPFADGSNRSWDKEAVRATPQDESDISKGNKMHRFGLIKTNLQKQVRRPDFLSYPQIREEDALHAALNQALHLLLAPGSLAKNISYSNIAGKQVARASTYSAVLALRLINSAVLNGYPLAKNNREIIVQSLKAILSEQVRFKIYKMDVKSFYESFDKDYTAAALASNLKIPSATKLLIEQLVENHISNGNKGLPRGLTISPSLSDALMLNFDERIETNRDVFFYKRYVDDITIITSGRENSSTFARHVEEELPPGLVFKLKKDKLFELFPCNPKSGKTGTGNQTKYLELEYLGYSFNVAHTDHNYSRDYLRDVWLDIAPSKVKKIKSRLLRSYIDFCATKDFCLLEKRIKHLTSNISIKDRSKGITRLSGIHFSYPLVDVPRSKALRALDSFLRNSLSSTSGKIFKDLSNTITPSQKNVLLRYSFYSGAKNKRFYQLNLKELAKVQRCWKYAK
jgi:hypothetical protein